MLSNIDYRDEAAIRAGIHAVARLAGYSRVVRGIDRFTHLPTRERAAVVWVSGTQGMGAHHCEVVALDDIKIRTGGQ